MLEHKIPNGWIQAKISDISIKGLQRKPAADETFTYVDIGSIDRSLKKISDPQMISGDNAPSRARKVIESGNVLVSLTRPNLNAVAMVELKYHKQIASTGFEVIKPLLVDSRYIFALVRSKEFIDQISGVVQGALYPAAKSSDVQNYEFPLPPLAEQKVIADKLDTLLAQVENTKARLERIPQILKRFRQSVLAYAVSGRLTKEWRERHVAEDTSEKVFSTIHYINDEDQMPVPENWLLTAMGNVSKFQQGLQIAKSTRRMEPGEGVLPILRTVNYENNFKNNVHYAVVSDKSIIAEPEDIILSRTGTVGLVLTGFKGIMHNNSFRVNFQKDLFVRRYLIYFLRSRICQEYVKRESGRSSQPDLTHKAFAKCPVTVPTRAEQTEIVRQVDNLFARADRIEQQVNNALVRVNSLSQSILVKAFRGELTQQWRSVNSELISGENSAEALLERIKVERAAQAPQKRTKKKVKIESKN